MSARLCFTSHNCLDPQIKLKLEYDTYHLLEMLGQECTADPGYSLNDCMFTTAAEAMVDEVGCTVPFLPKYLASLCFARVRPGHFDFSDLL